MDVPSSSTRELARRLVAMEAASGSVSDSSGAEVEVVVGKLQSSLTRFAGTGGFAALLRRALALAASESPSLRDVKVTVDGRLEGLDGVGVAAGSDEAPRRRGGKSQDGEDEEPAVSITAHLIWLLITFIGEPLTLQLIQEAWPDASLWGESGSATKSGDS